VPGRSGWILRCDQQDTGEATLNLYHARYAWWPIPDSAFSGGTFTVDKTITSWDLSALPLSAVARLTSAMLVGVGS
jgi:hypothetical protein